MTGGIVAEAMLRVTGWGIAGLPRRFRRRPVPATVPAAGPATTPTTDTTQRA
jgi:dolichol-phosphate mannosyltransferase